MNFSQALDSLKLGSRVQREGWNGKGMYIVIMRGYDAILANRATIEAHKLPDGSMVSIRPYIAMMDAQGMIAPGWLASQTDILAEDWQEVS